MGTDPLKFKPKHTFWGFQQEVTCCSIVAFFEPWALGGVTKKNTVTFTAKLSERVTVEAFQGTFSAYEERGRQADSEAYTLGVQSTKQVEWSLG